VKSCLSKLVTIQLCLFFAFLPQKTEAITAYPTKTAAISVQKKHIATTAGKRKKRIKPNRKRGKFRLFKFKKKNKIEKKIIWRMVWIILLDLFMILILTGLGTNVWGYIFFLTPTVIGFLAYFIFKALDDPLMGEWFLLGTLIFNIVFSGLLLLLSQLPEPEGP
jgi:hypothetical protein